MTDQTVRLDLRSDNVAGAAPQVVAAIAAAAEGTAAPYGNDPWTERVTRRLSEVFEREVTVFPVATGTAANALALASLAEPWQATYCHPLAHINVDECGAPEAMTGGAKLVLVDGADAKLDPGTLSATLDRAGAGVVHHVQPGAVSLTQATEAGTVYQPAEIAALSAIAREHGLPVHMDGARFANALVSAGCTPAEMTWRAGVDVLCFGATKNGAMAAEAVVFFDPERAASFGFRRKRFGHLFSKMRLISAQLDAYLADDLWLALARHANAQATRLAEGLTAAVPEARLAHPVDANEIFMDLPEETAARLRAAGFLFLDWDGTVRRLVTSFRTDPVAIDQMVEAARRLAA